MSNRPSDSDSEDETPLSALVHHRKEVTANDLIDTEDEVPIAVLNSFPARGGISRPFWVPRWKRPQKSGKFLSDLVE